ncbi:MAG: GTP-binding protein TypA [Candidatus Daviesbacteria bacterium GW2011_GWA2_38_24]|uniref:50S ribosomal subunit assembly factor BipA n=1 Tax=Candidatus Daviesbacteria bacterium GW2011_GWA2_38_24 TaxID=1618422 RepID=A0A0G0JKC4_9BACT|nr:MAG: GTP-binding protein TypA [Candidatus Daviesbacteria bacterium GW2011_GWA2_38_24]OGE24453.1 MAG: GTP-binding protein TypA [Candidatus Daviesbacteria bacterium RIFCSPHIGHO2_01_FULL_38_8]
MSNIRNVAIIAHVDHGKTTLVDALLRQTQTKLSKELSDASFIMDSNELEKERGITIFSKNASVKYKGTKINIVDTPGHADFGGEVERVLKLADGCLLLVDAKEGPMPQTRFVLKQALNMGLKIIVVINKIDKPDSRIDYVINKTFDLFLELGADESSAFFPIVYASAKNGLAGNEPNLDQMKDINPIFEAIIEHIPAPSGSEDKYLQMLITSISSDNFKGRIATGRIYNGKISANQEVIHISREGTKNKYRLSSLMTFEGLERIDTLQAKAGDIVAIAGIPEVTIGETITDNFETEAMPLLSIEEPTVKMTFGVNTSPFAGKEGEFKTSRQIQERLKKAMEDDVALKVEETDKGWSVSGRGELHLAILIERLRREGYEFQVSRPQVIEKIIEDKLMTPFEKVFIEVPEEYSGVVMQKMGFRHGKLENMTSENGLVSMEFIIATKELFGYRSEFITDTKGLGVINTNFYEFASDNGSFFTREHGSLVVHEAGVTKLYGLTGIQDRGALFLGPGVLVYKGQVVGRNARLGDMSVNVCKEKQQTNMRSKGEGVSEHFNAPRLMDLEDSLEYIDDTELVEITPKNIRIRKIDLNGTR